MKHNNDFDGWLSFSRLYHDEYTLDCQHQGVKALSLESYRKRYFFWLIDLPKATIVGLDAIRKDNHAVE